jgi:hypothetical protein
MADADRAVMRRAFFRPCFRKVPRRKWEAVAAVGIADLERGTGHRFALGSEQEDFAACALDDRQQGDWSMAHAHLYRKAFAGLAVIERKRHKFDLAFRDCGVSGAIMSPENHIVFVIDKVEFRERAACIQKVHNFHGESIFDFAFAGDGNMVGGEEGVSRNN